MSLLVELSLIELYLENGNPMGGLAYGTQNGSATPLQYNNWNESVRIVHVGVPMLIISSDS